MGTSIRMTSLDQVRLKNEILKHLGSLIYPLRFLSASPNLKREFWRVLVLIWIPVSFALCRLPLNGHFLW